MTMSHPAGSFGRDCTKDPLLPLALKIEFFWGIKNKSKQSGYVPLTGNKFGLFEKNIIKTRIPHGACGPVSTQWAVLHAPCPTSLFAEPAQTLPCLDLRGLPEELSEEWRPTPHAAGDWVFLTPIPTPVLPFLFCAALSDSCPMHLPH